MGRGGGGGSNGGAWHGGRACRRGQYVRGPRPGLHFAGQGREGAADEAGDEDGAEGGGGEEGGRLRGGPALGKAALRPHPRALVRASAFVFEAKMSRNKLRIILMCFSQ